MDDHKDTRSAGFPIAPAPAVAAGACDDSGAVEIVAGDQEWPDLESSYRLSEHLQVGQIALGDVGLG